jgi:hypothetical protein
LNGSTKTKTGLPFDVTINELALGIDARLPVVQVIEVVVLAVIAQAIPSIVTDNAVPKFVPLMTNVVPPMLGPNLGFN